MVTSVQESVRTQPWPNVKADVMRAQDLTFPDNFFTHSFTTFVVANLDDGPIAAGHLYRTLKPGGTAVVCTWKSMPHDEALKKAHYATRGKDAKLALTWGGDWLEPWKLKEFVVSGGFKVENIRMDQCNVWLKVKDLRRWTIITWSFLAKREGAPWVEEDEEKWEDAVGIFKSDMENGPDCKKMEDGSFMLRFVANVAIATK